MSRHIKPRSEFFKSRSFVRICHHAPTALLGILVTALIVLVAGYGASRTSEFQWFLLKGLAALPIPASAMDHNARTRGLAGRSTSSAAGASRCSDGGGIEGKPLHGARRVDPGTPAEMGLPGAARDVPVVTYCVVVIAPPNLPRACVRPVSHTCKIWRAPFSGGRISIAHL